MKNIPAIIITLLFIPLFLQAVTEESIRITKFSDTSVQFNEKYDPLRDSPMNFFDGDKKTSGVYSGFRVEFSRPAVIDEIKIVNGNLSDKALFKKYGRARDIEITLYVQNTQVKKGGDKTPPVQEKNNKDKGSEKQLPGQVKPSDEKKNDPGNRSDIHDTTAGIKPVTGTLNMVLAEEPKIDILTQDEPIAKKKTDDETGILKGDSAVETLQQPSKDILKGIKKEGPADKKLSSDKNKTGNKVKSKLSGTGGMHKKKSVKRNGKKDIESDKLKKQPHEKEIPIEPLKKMSGVVKIDNNGSGRIMAYVSLRDSAEQQSIRLRGSYNVTGLEFRGRDDENFKGSDSDFTYMSEIAFSNKGKNIAIEGIDELKKEYIGRYSRNLVKSISGEIFSAWNGNDEIIRMRFSEDGRIQFKDRYTCMKKGDADCTSKVMPHRWKIENGKLYMMYGRDWILWKYELDPAGNITDENSVFMPPRWIRLYYKDGHDFSQNYLYLERSSEREWRWDN